MKGTLTLLTVSALALAGLAGTTGTAQAEPVPPGGGGCVWHAYGTPGLTTFTLHVDTNTCGLKIHAYAQCSNWPFGTETTEGNNITGTGTSTVYCSAFGVASGGYGYRWAPQGTSDWSTVELGKY